MKEFIEFILMAISGGGGGK